MPEARRVLFRGIDLSRPVNRLRAGWVAFAQNVRALLRGAFGLRAPLTDAIYTLSAAVRTVERLNDTTPAGPPSGFALISVDANGSLYCNGTRIAVGLTGNPVSMIPFRPNTSVQPWMYIGDSAPDGDVVITTKFAIDGTPTTFACSGLVKVRSDGLVYKTGIKEPQTAPAVSTAGTTTTGTASLPATTFPWTNAGGANSTYNYGQRSSGSDGTAPVTISTPVGAQTLALVVTGTATVNGATAAPGDTGPIGSAFPTHFTGAGPTIVVGAFTDGSGNVLTGTSPVPLLANVGAGITLQVPAGALNFQVGVDSSANTFSANSGSFSIAWTLVTSAIATKVSTLGNVTAYYWGDSPHSGPVAEYIWRSPTDTGGGTVRTISTAKGSVTNNSWMFDSSPEDGTVPMQWSTLDSSGTVVGSIPLFSPALETEGFQDFNMCVVGTLFIPAPGTYAFTFKNKDQIMVGIGGGVTTSSSQTTGPFGQTVSVVNALPLVYVSTPNGSGGAVTVTVNITFAASGSYQMEMDGDYWFHTGRSFIITCNGANIPPLPSGVRTNTVYWAKYRSSPTGAVSNPGPGSDPQVTPVLDNQISCEYSYDPQVDKVDYYRQDSGLTVPTYVATGPNTNPPTAITDSLSDTDAAANPTMNRDDFEPFPSIDLPKKGTVNVTGGVITWVSGDTFNVRWLAGTIILIGYPTQIAYSLIARPTSTTSMGIPTVPDGTNLVYNIAEPILAAQPLPYQWGPTDNINFTYGCGDPLRPGTLYWCKGSNLDSAPDTNQQDVTDPSEPLINGAMSGGLGALFSNKRMWIILPNYFNALATATGTSGSQWTLQATNVSRGLYIPRCVAVEGGGKIFFRVEDGAHMSPSGNGSKSITDDELYPIFEHEGNPGHAITRNGMTIYPPDDTQPLIQQFSVVGQYLYWTYPFNLNGATRSATLVYDIEAAGWIWDLYALGPEALGADIVPVMSGNWDTPSNALSTTLYTDFIVNTSIPSGLSYPIAPGPGESVAWSVPPVSSGVAHITRMGPLAAPNNTGSLSISGFTMPTLPAGATITHVYVVAHETYTSTATPPVLYVNTPTFGEPGFPSSGLDQVYSLAISAGSVPTLVKNQTLFASSSTGPGFLNDPCDASWTIVNIAIAVYYTGGTPPSPLLLAAVSVASLPSDAVITGVKAAWEDYNDSGSATSTVNLRVNGVDGTTHALSWPTSVTPDSWGGVGNLWGWTANQLAAGFTVVWMGPIVGSSFLRHLVITVYYNSSLVGTVLCFSANEGESVQGVIVGCTDGTIRQLESAGTETVTGTVITGAIGGEGFRHCAGFTIEYQSNAAITLTPFVADSGNGSYAPTAVTLPSTSGGTAKFRSWFSPNKWKLMEFQFSFTDETALVFIQGFEVDCRDWGAGGEYEQVSPFGEEGGFGGQK